MITAQFRLPVRVGLAGNPTRARLALHGLLAGGLAVSMVACASSSNGGGSGGTTATGGAGTTTTAEGSGGTTTTTGASTTTNAGGSGGTVGASATTTGVSGSGGSGDASVATTGTDGALGPWKLTADYPLAARDCAGTAPYLYCAQQTCVASSGYVYCVGGRSTSTYYSQLSSAGLGPWVAATDYPVTVENASCVTSGSYIYCAGGTSGNTDGGTNSTTSDVYYAPVSPGGIGTWSASTPLPTTGADCMANAGYIYCVARGATRSAYYAPLSSNGVGTWAPTAAPPTVTQTCSAIDGYAYCYGGGSCAPRSPPSDCYSPSYFAPLTASGIGAWKETTELPTAVSATYATAGAYLYYLSIPAYFARVSADGIGHWQTTTNYPDSAYANNCFASETAVYCASPLANGSYFAQIGVANPQALQLENPPPYPRSVYLVPAWYQRGGCSVSVNGVSAGAPCFDRDVDGAVIFDCAAQAATSAGCATTVQSSDPAYNYDVTVWYPCPGQTSPDTNCCFQPKLGYDAPFDGWCISVGSNSFIIAEQVTMNQSQ